VTLGTRQDQTMCSVRRFVDCKQSQRVTDADPLYFATCRRLYTVQIFEQYCSVAKVNGFLFSAIHAGVNLV